MTEAAPEFKSLMCLICGWIYNEAEGYPEEGIPPGTRWADVPPNWGCPECGARKEDFEMVEI
jgi:rubredoxin